MLKVCSVESEEKGKMSAPGHDAVAVIKPGQTYVGKQGFAYGRAHRPKRSARGRSA
jgi:hypothetical protein